MFLCFLMILFVIYIKRLVLKYTVSALVLHFFSSANLNLCSIASSRFPIGLVDSKHCYNGHLWEKFSQGKQLILYLSIGIFVRPHIPIDQFSTSRNFRSKKHVLRITYFRWEKNKRHESLVHLPYTSIFVSRLAHEALTPLASERFEKSQSLISLICCDIKYYSCYS
jgi:hypothetical protein